MSEHLEKAKENPLSRSYTERLERIDWNESVEYGDEKSSGVLVYTPVTTKSGFSISESTSITVGIDQDYNEVNFNIEELSEILNEAGSAFLDKNWDVYYLVSDVAVKSVHILCRNCRRKDKTL